MKILRNFFPKSGDSSNGAVAISACAERFFELGHDRLGRMEIRFPKFQVDDGPPLALELLGTRKNGERALAAHPRESGSQCAHSVLLLRDTLWDRCRRNA